MKRKLAVLLAGTMVMASLVGCGGSDAASTETAAPAEETAEEAPAEEEAPDEEEAAEEEAAEESPSIGAWKYPCVFPSLINFTTTANRVPALIFILLSSSTV